MATCAVLTLATPPAADGQLLAGPAVTDAARHLLRQLALLANSETSSIQAVNFDHVRALMQLWQGAVPLRGGWPSPPGQTVTMLQQWCAFVGVSEHNVHGAAMPRPCCAACSSARLPLLLAACQGSLQPAASSAEVYSTHNCST